MNASGGLRPPLAFLFVAALVAGCTGTPEVPPGLTWPLRTDRLIEKLPTTPPTGPAPAGQFDASLAELDRLGGKSLDPTTLPEPKREQIRQALDAVFGTPAAPTLGGEAEATALRLTPDRLAPAMRLYRRHCLQCHGSAGDGRGPAGPWVYPLPRDFRTGGAKFVSVPGGVARRDDIVRVMRNRLEGTSMPSFAGLPQADLDLLADAVVHLSLRGRAEAAALRAALGDEPDDPENEPKTVIRATLATGLRLQAAVEAATPPPAVPDASGAEEEESIRRGDRLFADPKGAGCGACHVDYGRKSAYRYDVWGAAVKPNDLTAGVFKAGRGTQDVTWRIRCGIAPSGMPAGELLTAEQVADLVRFVRALPERGRLPADVRERVYGKE